MFIEACCLSCNLPIQRGAQHSIQPHARPYGWSGSGGRVQIDYPTIRSIVVSGNATATEAGSAGALGFVAKPYLPQTMVQAVHDKVLRH